MQCFERLPKKLKYWLLSASHEHLNNSQANDPIDETLLVLEWFIILNEYKNIVN